MIIIIIVIIMVNDPNASIIGMRREMIHRQIVQLSMDEWIQVWFGVGDCSSFFLERVIIAWWHNSISHDVMCWLLCATWFHLLWTVMRWDVSRSRKNSLHGEWIMMMALKASHDVEPVWFIMQVSLSLFWIRHWQQLKPLKTLPNYSDYKIYLRKEISRSQTTPSSLLHHDACRRYVTSCHQCRLAVRKPGRPQSRWKAFDELDWSINRRALCHCTRTAWKMRWLQASLITNTLSCRRHH